MAEDSDSAFQELVAKARDYAIPRNQRMFSRLHPGSGRPRMDWKVVADDVAFIVNGVPRVHARFQIIGLQRLKENTWRWGWADPQVGEELGKDAVLTRRYGEDHAIAELTTPEIAITPQLPTDLTAIAAMLCSGDATWPLVRQRGLFELVVLHELRDVTNASA